MKTLPHFRACARARFVFQEKPTNPTETLSGAPTDAEQKELSDMITTSLQLMVDISADEMEKVLSISIPHSHDFQHTQAIEALSNYKQAKLAFKTQVNETRAFSHMLAERVNEDELTSELTKSILDLQITPLELYESVYKTKVEEIEASETYKQIEKLATAPPEKE